jgi:hypothetical protein
LLRRLLDDDAEVVKAALSFPNLMKIADKEKLFHSLKNLYLKRNSEINSLIIGKLNENNFIFSSPQYVNHIVPFVFDLISIENLNVLPLASKLKHPLFFEFPSSKKFEKKEIIEILKNNLITNFDDNFEIISSIFRDGFGVNLIKNILNSTISTKSTTLKQVNSIFELLKKNENFDQHTSDVFQSILVKLPKSNFSFGEYLNVCEFLF